MLFINLEYGIENYGFIVGVNIRIGFPESVKQTVTEPVVQGDFFRNVLFGIDVSRRFESVLAFELVVVDTRIGIGWFQSSGIERIINRIHAIIELEVIRNIILEIVFDVVVLDARIPFEPDEIQIQTVIIIAINER